jgi:hypothetical protein
LRGKTPASFRNSTGLDDPMLVVLAPVTATPSPADE